MKTLLKIVLTILSMLLVIAFYARYWESPIEKVLSDISQLMQPMDSTASNSTSDTDRSSITTKMAVNNNHVVGSGALKTEQVKNRLLISTKLNGSVSGNDYSQKQEVALDMSNVSVLVNETARVSSQPVNPQTPNQRERNVSLMQLSPTLIKGIKNFVFFVGYPRSGHSIVGTLMDAHPHVIISNEFNLFSSFADLDKVPASRWRENLYNLLYGKSAYDVYHSRGDSKKGYSLTIRNLWQGRFDRYIEVIGDKSGDITTRAYMRNKTEFLRNYQLLKERVRVPTRVIHVLRNPFDIISTSLVIVDKGLTAFRQLKNISSPVKFNTSHVNGRTKMMFKEFNATMELVEEVFGKGNVLHVHNCDLVSDPRGTVSRIFEFLGVEVSTHYLDVCAEKVYKSVSRTRNTVVWTPEQREMVERRMKGHELLSRYSFTST